MSREARDWAWEAVRRLDVPPMARLVLLRIAERADARGTVRVLRQTLADDVGMVDGRGRPTTAFDRALSQLRAAGALTSSGTKTATGDQGANVWRLPVVPSIGAGGPPQIEGDPSHGSGEQIRSSIRDLSIKKVAAGADDLPDPAYPQEPVMDDEQPDLFAEAPDAAPAPDAAKAHQKAKRQRPKTGAPLVVATWIDSYTATHGCPPLATSKDHIGRNARSMLAHGSATEDELVEAARRLGLTPYESLDVELKKLRQERHAHNERTGAAAAQRHKQTVETAPQSDEERRAAIEAGRAAFREQAQQSGWLAG